MRRLFIAALLFVRPAAAADDWVERRKCSRPDGGGEGEQKRYCSSGKCPEQVPPLTAPTTPPLPHRPR